MKKNLFIFLSLFIGSCFSQKFYVPYKVYDFYHRNLDLISTILNTQMINQSNQLVYCANEKFNFISNEEEYDQSFIRTPGLSKDVINTFTFNPVHYSNGKVKYVVTLKPFTPIKGKRWNEGVSGENRYWCIEGHYKFKYQVSKKTSYFFSLCAGGDISAFIDGKLAFEFAGTGNPDSAVNHKNLNLEVGKTYPFDFFMCQRFDQNKPFVYLQFDTPFVFQCNNIPGVNDDVCPPQCVPEKDCNGSSFESYCTHTLIECDNSNKCKPNSCNVKNGKCEQLPEIKCPPKKTIDLLGIGVGCQPEMCEPSSGNCIPDSSKGLLDKLLC